MQTEIELQKFIEDLVNHEVKKQRKRYRKVWAKPFCKEILTESYSDYFEHVWDCTVKEGNS